MQISIGDSSYWALAGFELAALFVIAVIDFIMGAEAQTLNGYKILRRTFALPLGIDMPEVTQTYIFWQDKVGRFAFAWAWPLYSLWGSVFAFPLHFIVRKIV